MNEKYLRHIVLFDGTTAFVTTSEELLEGEDFEVLGIFSDFNTAFDFCEKENEKIKGKTI